jgi:restriction endonuclease S subunit
VLKSILSDLVEIQVGYQSRESIQEDPKGSHQLIQARDFDKNHQIQWGCLSRFNPNSLSIRYQVNHGDTLFLAKGQEHFAYFIDRDLEPTLAANTFYILRNHNEQILPAYLAWWLNQKPAQTYFLRQRGGSSIPFVPVSTLSKLEISLPTLELQTKILSLDRLRKKEEELTGSLLLIKTSLYEVVCLKAVQK